MLACSVHCTVFYFQFLINKTCREGTCSNGDTDL